MYLRLWFGFALLFVLCSGEAAAQGPDLDRFITVKYKDAPLGQILEDLRSTHGVDLGYSPELVPVELKLTILLKKQSIRTVLNTICEEAKLSYQVIGNKVILAPERSPTVNSDQKFTISGYVEDAATGEKLIGATVLEASTNNGRTTSVYGFYSLSLDRPDAIIIFSFVGYERKAVSIDLRQDSSISVELEPNLELGVVDVVEDEEQKKLNATQMSTIEVNMRELDKLPTMAGDVDVLGAIQRYPGVHFGDEGAVTLYVRGGGPDQNLIMLDGVPIYNTYHLFGLVSIFNAASINSVKLVKAGYPARYGGRLSSVLDVRMKEGNMKKFHGEASVGLLTSQVTLEGPIKKDTTSFLFSVRRTYADLIASPIIEEVNRRNGVDNKWNFNFLDANAKLNHKFSNKDRLYLSAYYSQDNGLDRRVDAFTDTVTGTDFRYDNEYVIGWSNFTSALRWNHLFNNKLFSNTTLLYSDYRFNILESAGFLETFPDSTFDSQTATTEYNSDIRDIGFRFDFHYYPSRRQEIQFGGATTVHRFRPGVSAITGTDVAIPDTDSLIVDAIENSLFLEDDISIGEKFRMNLGIHASQFIVEDTTYRSLQPRVAMRYLLRPQTTLRASYAHMAQFLHLLNNAQIGFPVDLWVPVTRRIGPQRSQQAAIGVSTYPNEKLEVTVEAYYRNMENIIEYENGASFVDPTENWEDKVEIGNGDSYGFEFLLRHSTEKFNGWLSYTWSRTQRSFSNINEGRTFPYKYDRTHDISLTMVRKLSKRTSVSAAWVYGTGTGITVPEDRLPQASPQPGLLSANLFAYSDRNAFRLRDYHRLDLSVTISKEKKWGERLLNFSIYNAYNRRNPYYMYLSSNADGDLVFKEVSYFPIIPSFRYAIRF